MKYCDCSRRATTRANGADCCARCAMLDRPHKSKHKKAGVKASGGLGAANIDWQHYHLWDKDDGPIAGGSLLILERMLRKNAA